jgi:hypothetical protein
MVSKTAVGEVQDDDKQQGQTNGVKPDNAPPS